MTAKLRDSRLYVNRTGWIALACGLLLGLPGCGSLNVGNVNPVNWITPYKVDVIQGNFVSKEQVEALRVGLSRAQVRDLLGTPLLASLFHADRWDYVFTMNRQGVAPQAFKYAVFFTGDQLARFEGDSMPSDAEFLASLTNSRQIGKVPALMATEEQLKAAEKSPAPAAPVNAGPTAAPVGAPPASYPPLESARP